MTTVVENIVDTTESQLADEEDATETLPPAAAVPAEAAHVNGSSGRKRGPRKPTAAAVAPEDHAGGDLVSYLDTIDSRVEGLLVEIDEALNGKRSEMAVIRGQIMKLEAHRAKLGGGSLPDGMLAATAPAAAAAKRRRVTKTAAKTAPATPKAKAAAAAAPARARRGSKQEEAQGILAKVVALLKKHPDGLKAETIRSEVGVESKPLMGLAYKIGLETKALRKRGERRATEYYVR